MKIETYFVSTPALWCTYDADSYDGAEDAGPQAVGYGKTQEEAIADFHEQREALEARMDQPPTKFNSDKYENT